MSKTNSKATTKGNSTAASKGGKRLMLNNTDDFNITKWSNTDIDFEDEKNKEGNQFTCYGRYNYGKESAPVQNQLVFKTGPFKLVTYGIPPLGKFAKTDKDRSYVKIPFDTTQESCVSLFKMFQELDTWAVKNKDKFFSGKLSKFAKLYDYTPIVRKPQEQIPLDDDDDGESTKKQSSSSSEKPLYAKIKISTDFESGDVNTTVFLREEGVPVKQEVKTVTDMASLVTWQSTVQMICSCNKLWFSRSADKTGRRQYGISFKILQCEVTDKPSGGAKSDFTTYAFDDSVKVEEKDESESESESDSEDEKKPQQEAKKTEKRKEASPTKDESDSDSDDDSDEDSEEEKKATTKSAVVQESDDESDEDSEEEKPAPKQATKKTVAKGKGKKAAESDDDDESEDEPPVKSTKKVAKSAK
jgi:hypothetical protein